MLYFEDLQVGARVVLGSHELFEEDIIAFAKKWDPQPYHIDPEAAALTPMKGLTASSCHTYSVMSLIHSMGEPVAGIAGLKHEMEIPAAARPGDILSLTVTYLDKRLSESKPDRGLVTFERVLTNQTGEIVMRVRSLGLVRCRPSTN